MSNRTSKYLSWGLQLHNSSALDNILKNLGIIRYYVADSDYYKAENITEMKHFLFLLVDTYGIFDFKRKSYKDIGKGQENYKKSIQMLESMPMYVDSYTCRKKNDARLRVLVLELPDTNKDVMKLFYEGKYSKIWTKEELAKMSNIPSYTNEVEIDWNLSKAVLERKDLAKREFVEILKKEYKTASIGESDLAEDAEYDLPAKFNFKAECLYSDEAVLYMIGMNNMKEESLSINSLE